MDLHGDEIKRDFWPVDETFANIYREVDNIDNLPSPSLRENSNPAAPSTSTTTGTTGDKAAAVAAAASTTAINNNDSMYDNQPIESLQGTSWEE